MEDPVAEIRKAIAGFVQNKDFKLQEETIYRYFSSRHNIDFDHELIRDNGDVHKFLYIFKFWSMYNCEIRAEIVDIFYDKEGDDLIVLLNQFVRSWWNPFSAHPLPMMVEFKLIDEPDSADAEEKKPKKRIIAQYDMFSVSHGLSNTPIISSFYPEPWFRHLLVKGYQIFDTCLDASGTTGLWEAAVRTTKRMLKQKEC